MQPDIEGDSSNGGEPEGQLGQGLCQLLGPLVFVAVATLAS